MNLEEVVNRLGTFRNERRMVINETGYGEEDAKYVEGYLDGIEAAKNEVWRLNGDRPF